MLRLAHTASRAAAPARQFGRLASTLAHQAVVLPEDAPVSEEAFAALMGELPAHAVGGGSGPVAVAVSGGPDSMALAFLTHRYYKALGVPSVALTVDHGLREESAEEAKMVADTVTGWGMGSRVHKLKWEHGEPSTGKLQELARDQRQSALGLMCAKLRAGQVMLGHQADDNIETFLMRLGRASGVVGLAGMANASTLGANTSVTAVRPLLKVPRSALVATCKEHGIPFVNDPSNTNTDFDRVRARDAGLSLPRAGASTGAPTKEEVLGLVSFLADARASTHASVDEILGRCTWTNSRWGAIKVNVGELLGGRGTTEDKKAALRRVVEVVSGRGKAVRSSSADTVFGWMLARHGEYVATRDALSAMRSGEVRSSPQQRAELRGALTRILDVQTSLGGCIIAPQRPQRLRERLPGTDTFARSTPNLEAPLEMLVSPERSNRYRFSVNEAEDTAAPVALPNGPWVHGILGRWSLCVTYNPEEEAAPLLGERGSAGRGPADRSLLTRPQRPPRGSAVEVPPALATLVVRRLTPYAWDELMHLHPWLRVQLRAPNHMLKWGVPVVCREVDLSDPRVLWLTMRNHQHHSDQRGTFARRQASMVQMEARLGADNYAALVTAMPSRWRSMTQEAVAALSVVAVPGTRTTVLPGLRAYSRFSPRHLLYNAQRTGQAPRGFKPPVSPAKGKHPTA